MVELLKSQMERKLDLVSWLWSESKDSRYIQNAMSDTGAYATTNLSYINLIGKSLQEAGQNNFETKLAKIAKSSQNF